MDVAVKGELLWVRVKRGTKYWIQVLNRVTGDLINEMPSLCDHYYAQLKKHPQHTDSILEGCVMCEEIREYNIKMQEKSVVHREFSFRMFEGPGESLLVADIHCGLFQIDWSNGQSQEAQVTYIRNVPLGMLQKRYLRFCYVECHDILLCTVRDMEHDKDYEILAVTKLLRK